MGVHFADLLLSIERYRVMVQGGEWERRGGRSWNLADVPDMGMCALMTQLASQIPDTFLPVSTLR